MPPFSLFRPMQGLPWYLLPIWPLIYIRIQRLRAWFKANGGPGSQMLWAVTCHGRVDIVYLSDDISGHRPCSFRAPVSDRLAEAVMEPSPPRPRRTPGPQPIARGGPGLRREHGPMGPIPDT